jgi:N4-gp56 family major capsid protein
MAIDTNRTVGQSSTTIISFIPQYWDSVLGENLYPNLYLYQFGTKRQVPRNFGIDIKIPRLVKQNIVSEVVATSEGSVIATNRLSSNFVSGTLKQFAGAYRHSDVVIMTALSDVIELSLRDIARDIAKRMDTHIRDTLSGIGTLIGGSGVSSSDVLTTNILLSSDLLKAAVLLDDADNPRPSDGHFPFVTAPKAIYDLQSSLTGNSWLEMNKYGSDNQVQHYYRGETGRIFGTRVVTSTNTKRLVGAGGAGAMSEGNSGYRSFMFAPDSYFVTEISDMTAKTFVKQLGSAGALDPVNQVATVGAKVFFTAIPANWGSEVRQIRVIHGSDVS